MYAIRSYYGLASVDRLDYPNYKVVVIDNGSSDGSESFLRLNRSDLEIIQTGANLGFAGGFNIGIAEIFELDQYARKYLASGRNELLHQPIVLIAPGALPFSYNFV